MEQFLFMGGPYDGRREILPGDPVVRVVITEPVPVGWMPALDDPRPLSEIAPFTTVEYRLHCFRFNAGLFFIYLASDISEEDVPVLLLSGYRSF